MKEDEIDDISEKIDDASTGAEAHSTYVVPKDKSKHLSGMFQNWFLDYASYVILERAVPHIQDGLKPVQRRILHTMKELDDGRFNKVANIVGSTMQYHPRRRLYRRRPRAARTEGTACRHARKLG